MSDVLNEIDDFRRFAEGRLSAGEKPSVEELFYEWRDDARGENVLQADVRAIEEALRLYDAGDRGRPYDEVMTELRRKHGLP